VTARNDRSIETLIRLAGGRELPSAEGTERARVAAEAAWRRLLAATPAVVEAPAASRRAFWGAFVLAAGIAVLAVLVLRREAEPIPAARIVAREGVPDLSGGETSVPAGTTIATGETRIATALPGGLSLRLDRHARVRFEGHDRVTLLEGVVYVDSGGLGVEAPLAIATPAGDVRHAGTQFLVAVAAGTTRVRVREGVVTVVPGSGGESRAVASGDELMVDGGAATWRHGLPSYGMDWEWSAQVAPALAIEGRPLGEFLAWIAREHGWQLRFRDDALQTRVREIRLHGSLEGLDVAAMLERVGLVTGVSLAAHDGVLWVGAGVPP